MDVLDAVRRPEYTGERRCWPCTVVNAVLVALATAVLAVASVPLALLTLVAGAALIALRGYVVPGTPSFAPRLVERLGLEHLFHAAEPADRRSEGLTGEATDGDDEDADPDPEALLGALVEAGVLDPDEDGDLHAAEAFTDRWREEMRTLRAADDERLAAAVAAAVPFEGEGEATDTGIRVIGPERATALTRTHAVCDVSAVRALTEFDVPEHLRAPATTPLRLFAPECPACGGALEETRDDNVCCGPPKRALGEPDQVFACVECGEVLYRFED